MLELMKSQIDTGIGLATAVIGLIALAITSFFKIFSLYDKHWSRRNLKALADLRTTRIDDSSFEKYLDETIFIESFRIASGIRGNRRKVDYMLRLAAVGHWNRHQMLQISKFVETTAQAPEPVFRITRWQVAGARISLAFTILLMAMGFLIALGVMLKRPETLSGIAAGFSIEIAFIIAAALVGTSYNTYKIARNFENHLKKHPEIAICNTPAADIKVK